VKRYIEVEAEREFEKNKGRQNEYYSRRIVWQKDSVAEG